MVITLTYATLYETVSRSLSIIGKRSVDDEGHLLFKDITLGSREQGIISDYFRQAVIDLAAETASHITASTDTSVTLTLPTSHNTALEPFIQKACAAYCESFALYSWLFITAPRLAPRYLDDCKRQLSAVVRLVNEKKAPQAAASSPLDISTSVT